MKFEVKTLRILVGLSTFVFLCMNSGRGYWHCSLEECAGPSMLLITRVRNIVPARHSIELGKCTGGDQLYSGVRRRNLVLQVVHMKRELVLYRSQDPRRKLVQFRFQGKGTGEWCSNVFRRRALVHTVIRRREQVHYCSQEKETGALLFSGEGNWCSTVFTIRYLVLYCSQEKETGALLFSRRRKQVHYCSKEKETGALLFLGK